MHQNALHTILTSTVLILGVILAGALSGADGPSPTDSYIDLTITTADTSLAAVAPGETFTLWSYTYANEGTSGTGTDAVRVRIYLSNDATIDSGDRALATTSHGPLAAGASNTVALSVTMPSDVTAGSYTIGCIIDYDDSIHEISESNNTVSGPLTVALSDLTITAADFGVAPAVATPGTTVRLSSFSIVNQGPTPTVEDATTSVYLSTDSTIETTDTVLSTFNPGALDAGADYSLGGMDCIVPGDTAAGSYYIGMLADRVDNIAESDETNNSIATPLLVVTSVRAIGFTITDANDDGVSSITVTRSAVDGVADGAQLTTRSDGHTDDNGVDDDGEADDPLPFPQHDAARDQSFIFALAIPEAIQ